MCSSLSPIENGQVTYSQDSTVTETVATDVNGTDMNGIDVNGTYMNGTVATYQCHPAFTLIGNEMRACLEDATWSGSEPECHGEYVHQFYRIRECEAS